MRQSGTRMTPNERRDMPLIISMAAIVAVMMLFYWGVVLWKE